jgi:hypothetical protein
MRSLLRRLRRRFTADGRAVQAQLDRARQAREIAESRERLWALVRQVAA